jgi:hypothetical protein
MFDNCSIPAGDTDTEDGGNVMTLRAAMNKLSILNEFSEANNTNSTSSVLSSGDSVIGTTVSPPSPPTHHHHSFVAGSHMRFRHGRRDNTGLRVLVVSVDDRDVAEELKSNDYVSMTSVLQHDYCLRHGYDYVSFRTDNDLLYRGMVEKYPNVSVKPE